MRGRNNKRRETAKHGRRFVLAGLIVASGQFAQAETPVAVVPLPLTPLENEHSGMRSNPFCQPVIVEAPATKTRSFPEPVMVAPLTTLAGQGRYQENHFLQTHRPADGSVVLTSGGELQRKSAATDNGDGMRTYLQAAPANVAGGVRSNPLVSRIQLPQPMGPDLQSSSGISFSFSDDEPMADNEAEQADQEPIELSFSDDSEADTADQDSDTDLVRNRPTTRPAKKWNAPTAHRTASGLPEPVNLRMLEPQQFASGRILQVPVPEANEPDTAEKPGGIQPLETMAISPDESRLVNGSRPRVEVGRPTVAVDRLASMSIIPGKPRVLAVDQEEVVDGKTGEAIGGNDVQRPHTVNMPGPIASTRKMLQSVLTPSDQAATAPGNAAQTPKAGTASVAVSPSPSPQPSRADTSVPKDTEESIVSRFTLKPTEVRAIAIDSPVAHVQSDNMAVCAVLKSASGLVQVIATGEGTTRLSVHVVGKDGVEKINRYEVAVGEVRASSVDSPESIAMTLTQTVQSAFPGANVLVSAEAGRLVVTGSCTDEDAARRMLRMIRSACAIPVVDRVKVR